MKKITIGITLSKEFDSCQQWSQNRAWQKDNPNKSRDNINFTYAMSEDDEIFFKEYSETVVAEVTVDDLFKLFRKYTKRCFTEDYEYDYDNDFAKFNYVVTNNFPVKALHILLFQYIKYRILYYWYWEKNMYEDLQYVELELEKLKESIKSMTINESLSDDEDIDDDPLDVIPYNDGFVINPPRKRRTIPTQDDATTVIGIDTSVPEVIPEVSGIWYFIKNLPNEIIIEDINNSFNLEMTFDRKKSEYNKDYQQIKLIFHKGNQTETYQETSKTLPLEINIGLAYTNDYECFFEIFLVFNDGSEEKILESNHCHIRLVNNGIYTAEYNEQYS